ncbi:hypothetical protein BT69DRAFT_562088 [Atractiella rhizophila]|nr:hypothetical protein BT69DRAFT_562088 [Atractiella rhizophila]
MGISTFHTSLDRNKLPRLRGSLRLLILLSPFFSAASSSHHSARGYTTLSSDTLTLLNSLSTSPKTTTAQYPDTPSILDFRNPSSLLSQILIPRPIESGGLAKAQKVVTQQFASLSTNGSWELTVDEFKANTPYGEKKFKNLVFTHDPTAARFLLLSAHIDSKLTPVNFVGATDSAAPCAMMVDVATALNDWLEARRRRKFEAMEEGTWVDGGKEDESLRIVFFDGEEALKDWTHTDSIYGSRHLAEIWSKPIRSPSPTNPPITPLSQITTFILFDLLGAPHPVIRSFYERTDWLFSAFVNAEDRLGKQGWLYEGADGKDWKTKGLDLTASGVSGEMGRSFFKPKDAYSFFGSGIEDDHLPFLKAGVPILHLIASPFPSVWHRIEDDASALDYETVKAWALITRLVVAEYLGLAPPEEGVRIVRSVHELVPL